MRILIPGGTGLIGRSLAADLAVAGHEVILLSRNPEAARRLPSNVRVERWDGRTPAAWSHLADGAGAIINLTGENLGARRWTTERKQEIVESRTVPGAAIVAAVKSVAVKPKVVIQASAVGYYGPQGDTELTEKNGPGSDFGAKVCVDWEASTAPVEKLGVRRVVIRLGVVLSAESVALSRMLLPHRFFVGGPLGGGRQWFSWIHMMDALAAIRFLVERPEASGPFNLTAPGALPNAEFERALGKVMGRPSWLPVPGFAIRLLFGEMATVVLDGQRVIPRRLVDMGFQFHFSNAESALRDILRPKES